MKFARKLIPTFLIFIFVACATQSPTPPSTATLPASPTPITTTYYFAPHTADEAQDLLTQAEKAILEDNEHLEMPLSQYADYYRAALYAAWNAVLYFPDDVRVETWKWKMAYYAAMGGESTFAGKIYVEKISEALNDQNIRIEDLPNWFQSGELQAQYMTPHFEIKTQQVSIPHQEYAYLIQLGTFDDIDIPGAMCLLATKNNNTLTAYLIYNGFPSEGFFPTLRHPSYCTLEDLTGDGVGEVIAHNWSGGHVGTTSIQVFDISSLPPKVLLFDEPQDDKISAWNGTPGDITNSDGNILLPISEKTGQCDAYITRYYGWDGNQFELQNAKLDLFDQLDLSSSFCRYEITGYAQQYNAGTAVQILDQALQLFPSSSAQDKQLLDEIRIEKGLIYLFNNQPKNALLVFQDIVNSPIDKGGIWIKPVKNFLQIYQQPSDIYRACTALTACDPYHNSGMSNPNNSACTMTNPCQAEALEHVMSNQQKTQTLDDFIKNLQSAGIEIASKGWIDLESDGKNELWLTIAPPTHEYYGLWLVSDYPNGIHTFPVGAFPTVTPEFKIETITRDRTLIRFDAYGNYLWSRNPITNELTLESLYEWQDPKDTTDYITINTDLKEFEKLQSQLYSSNDFASIYDKLLALANRYNACPYQLAAPTTNFYKDECGNYYYTIGLAAELANDYDMAQKMYSEILNQYPTHPMAFLAQKKLNR